MVLDGRTPVAAVGCNAAPDVLRRKLQRAGVPATVPFAPATVTNVAVGHSAHVSVGGYVAAAPFAAPGTVTRVVVTWLDEVQLRCVDATERNYDRVRLAGDDVALVLDGGDRLDAFHLYTSTWGVIAPDGVPWPFCRQPELFTRLARLPGARRVLPVGPDVVTRMLALAADAGARDAAREWLAGFSDRSGPARLRPR